MVVLTNVIPVRQIEILLNLVLDRRNKDHYPRYNIINIYLIHELMLIELKNYLSWFYFTIRPKLPDILQLCTLPFYICHLEVLGF